MSLGWGSLDRGDLGEGELVLVVLPDVGPDDISLVDDLGLDDVNGLRSATVTTSHLVVHHGDSSAESVVSELLVHVDDSGSGLVLESDSVVLDCIRFSLEDLVNGHDLSVSGSNLVLSLHLVPELGTSQHWVLSEDSHSEQSWLWGSLSWKASSDNPVLSNLKWR